MDTLEPTLEPRLYSLSPLHRTSWGAIFGGSFLALAILTVLGVLGVAVGATTIDPLTNDTPSARAFGIGAGIWWLVSGLAALFAGGWATAVLAGVRQPIAGSLHGLVTWGFTTVVTIALMTTTLGAMVSGGLRFLGTGAAVTAQVTSQVLPEQRGTIPTDGKQAVVDALAKNTDMSQAEAQATVDRWSQELQAAVPRPEETGRRVADTAASAVAIAAWWTFVYFVLTMLTAALGGRMGAPNLRSARIATENG
jgi:hypothetical protein